MSDGHFNALHQMASAFATFAPWKHAWKHGSSTTTGGNAMYHHDETNQENQLLHPRLTMVASNYPHLSL